MQYGREGLESTRSHRDGGIDVTGQTVRQEACLPQLSVYAAIQSRDSRPSSARPATSRKLSILGWHVIIPSSQHQHQQHGVRDSARVM